MDLETLKKSLNIERFGDLLSKIPIVGMLPVFVRAWENLDDETKEKYAAVIMAAGMKALQSYSEKQ
jgi:hypothetical protein